MNEPVEPFPFPDADLEELGTLLGLDDEEELLAVVGKIQIALVMRQMLDKGRRSIPNYRAAMSRIDRIASTADVLARLLDEEPAAEKLVMDWQLYDVDGAPCRLARPSLNQVEAAKRLHDLVATLKLVKKTADQWSGDDELFRRMHMLPEAKDAAKSIETSLLWPMLFYRWEQAGKRVAQTAGGPLHRFVALVHRVGGLSKPSASTLKDAVIAWKQGGRAMF